ncbi:hypothetical protein CRUP_014741 [Coryphaenoides rupestris]|nr:hypothetical protein CRUP_014741 [Coryphaenoides rupestris]
MNTRGHSQMKDSVPVSGFCTPHASYGVQDTIRTGFRVNQEKMDLATVQEHPRVLPRYHSKLQMEYPGRQDQIQRLPFLPSSNLALDTLRATDETICFEDILNDPTQSEMMGEPHMMMEYQLGLF